MMHGVYSYCKDIEALDAAAGLVQILAGSLPVQVLRAELTSAAANNYMLDCYLARCDDTISGGGGTITPDVTEGGTPSAVVTIGPFESDTPTAGSKFRWAGEHAQSGWHYVPLDEEREWIMPGDAVCLYLNTDPPGAFDARITVVIREFGYAS